MNEIDIVYDYKNLYGYDWYSFRDATTELEMIREKKFKGSKTDVIIVYDNPRLKQSNFEPPRKDEKNNPKKYVSRILDEKYGKGNWKKEADSEYNKILKAVTRGGHKAWDSVK